MAFHECLSHRGEDKTSQKERKKAERKKALEERKAARKIQADKEKEEKKQQKEVMTKNRKIGNLASKMLQPLIAAFEKAENAYEKAMPKKGVDDPAVMALRHAIDELCDFVKACKDAMKAAAKGGKQPLEDLPCSTEKEFNAKLRTLNTLVAAAKAQGTKRKSQADDE